MLSAQNRHTFEKENNNELKNKMKLFNKKLEAP